MRRGHIQQRDRGDQLKHVHRLHVRLLHQLADWADELHCLRLWYLDERADGSGELQRSAQSAAT